MDIGNIPVTTEDYDVSLQEENIKERNSIWLNIKDIDN